MSNPIAVWLRRQWKGVRSPQGFFVLTIIIPLLVFYVGWMFIPFIQAIRGSFFEWKPLIDVPQKFLGFQNYVQAVNDPIFQTTLRNTLYFAIVKVPLGTVIPLAIALILNSMKRFVGLFRTLYFIPYITSLVACAIMWRWIYQTQYGFINTTIRQINEIFGLSLPWSIGWLTDKHLAMNSIITMSIWKDAGFALVIFLAGLQGVPSVFYDAAKVDGANTWQVIRHITIPLLRTTIMIVIVTGMIDALQVFTQIYVMTSGVSGGAGGPGNATRVAVLYLYEKAFDSFRFGYASALSVILFIIILAFTLVQLKVLSVRWEY